MAKKIFQTVRGTRDLLSDDIRYYDYIYQIFGEEAVKRGFQKIETPIFEDTGLFVRGVGKDTDIVEKEMYTFKDKSGNSITLRPEGTAPVVRAYLEDGMQSWPHPINLYYQGPMFRYDRPQAGRFREFYTFGVEVIGSQSALLDVLLIQMLWIGFMRLGIKDVSLQINSIGCPTCRPKYRKILTSFLSENSKKLCKDCLRRAKNNPLRVLDCKEKACRLVTEDAPILINNLCSECHQHFKEVLEWLEEFEIPYELNTKLVRGLDYYTKTVVEVWSKAEGGQSSLGGGGRYDGLVELLGGKPTSAVGFGIGVDRMVELMKIQEIKVPNGNKIQAYLILLGDEARKKGFNLLNDLLKAEISTVGGVDKDGLSGQLNKANLLGVQYAIIIGQKEAQEETAILKEMSSGNQETVAIAKIIKELKRRLK